MSGAKVLTIKKGFLMLIERHYDIATLREFSKQLEEATGERWVLICDAEYADYERLRKELEE